MKKSSQKYKLPEFENLSIPLIRRQFPKLFANKIVNVQPMNGPSGLAYAFINEEIRKLIIRITTKNQALLYVTHNNRFVREHCINILKEKNKNGNRSKTRKSSRRKTNRSFNDETNGSGDSKRDR